MNPDFIIYLINSFIYS